MSNLLCKKGLYLIKQSVFFAGIFFLSIPFTFAQGPSLGLPSSSHVGQLSTVLLSLLFVVTLIIGGGWILKRFNGANHPTAKKLKVLASLSVGTKERAILIKVGDTQMLLGVSPGNVNTLHVFDQPVFDEQEVATERGDFANVLMSISSRGAKK